MRGFPTNAVSGDKGYYFNFELHRDMSDLIKGLDIYAFTDNGAVYSTFPEVTRLESSGFGMSWTPFAPLTFEASVGFPWRSVVTNQRTSEFYGRVTFRPLLLLPGGGA